MIKSLAKYKLFAICYVAVIFILYMDQIKGIPFTGILRKSKYFLIIILVFFVLSNENFRKGKVYKGDIFIGLCLLHTIIFGIFFVNTSVISEIHINMREMLVFLLFVFGLYHFIIDNQCMKFFLELSWHVMASYLMVVAILYYSDFVNPVYYPWALSTYGRIRSSFGFIQYNRCAYAALAALLVGLTLFEYYRRNQLVTKIWMIKNGIPYIIIICMLFSTGGRGSILAYVLAVVIYLMCMLGYYKPKKFFLLMILLGIGLLTVLTLSFQNGFWNTFGDMSQRGRNISQNYPVFCQIGNFVTGMGYIDSDGFARDSFGYDTFNIDMYYVYIFFSTGILGCLIMGIAILYMCKNIICRLNSIYRLISIPILVAVLFGAIWDVNFFNYNNVSSVVISSLLLCFMSSDGNNDKNIKLSIRV